MSANAANLPDAAASPIAARRVFLVKKLRVLNALDGLAPAGDDLAELHRDHRIGALP